MAQKLLARQSKRPVSFFHQHDRYTNNVLDKLTTGILGEVLCIYMLRFSKIQGGGTLPRLYARFFGLILFPFFLYFDCRKTQVFGCR